MCMNVAMGMVALLTAQPRVLAENGSTPYTIVVSAGANAAEQHAAAELAGFLKQVTGATFRQVDRAGRGPHLYVGPGDHLAKAGVPDPATLGGDELVIATRGPDLVLVGGRPRGTLYAVYTFLEDVVGCRWWSSKVSLVPKTSRLVIPDVTRRERPAFEYREPFWWDAFDPDFAVRNKINGHRAPIDDKHGGHITYQGFVHTFNRFVPPKRYFKTHPEWFSERGGKRTADHSQLCLTNDALKAFMAKQVMADLRKAPKAGIVSVSQNDWRNPCQCARCAALAKAEGSEAGPMLHFVNAVAERVGNEFPHVAISTLAYQYTRRPPRHVRPRPNVIVRLCSIECNFAEPLGTGRTNAAFRKDIEGWAKVADRLYVWDYTTNFGHYIQPHPNLRVLGPNVRFFAANSVKGLFEQGNYQSHGGEFAELRAWVLAKLLWNPKQDDRKLIERFVRGYYAQAAPHVLAYIGLIHDAVGKAGHYLSIGSSPHAPFLTFDVLLKAQTLFDAAEKAVADQAEVLDRVRMARLPVQYLWLVRWREFRAKARLRRVAWPGSSDYKTVAEAFLKLARAHHVTRIREGAGLEAFAQRTVVLDRRDPAPPPGCENLPLERWVDLQDDLFNLWSEGKGAALRRDPTASDGVAAWMPTWHYEWAVQCRTTAADLGKMPGQPCSAYVAIRCEVKGTTGRAFTYGLYDMTQRQTFGHHVVNATDIKDDRYHVYEIGTFPMHSGQYLWVAPTKNPDNVKAIWVDRFYLVKPAGQGKAGAKK